MLINHMLEYEIIMICHQIKDYIDKSRFVDQKNQDQKFIIPDIKSLIPGKTNNSCDYLNLHRIMFVSANRGNQDPFFVLMEKECVSIWYHVNRLMEAKGHVCIIMIICRQIKDYCVDSSLKGIYQKRRKVFNRSNRPIQSTFRSFNQPCANPGFKGSESEDSMHMCKTMYVSTNRGNQDPFFKILENECTDIMLKDKSWYHIDRLLKFNPIYKKKFCQKLKKLDISMSHKDTFPVSELKIPLEKILKHMAEERTQRLQRRPGLDMI